MSGIYVFSKLQCMIIDEWNFSSVSDENNSQSVTVPVCQESLTRRSLPRPHRVEYSPYLPDVNGGNTHHLQRHAASSIASIFDHSLSHCHNCRRLFSAVPS